MRFRHPIKRWVMEKETITILYKNHHNTQCWKRCMLDKNKFKHLKHNTLCFVFNSDMKLLKGITSWEELEMYVDKKLREIEEKDLVKLE